MRGYMTIEQLLGIEDEILKPAADQEDFTEYIVREEKISSLEREVKGYEKPTGIMEVILKSIQRSFAKNLSGPEIYKLVEGVVARYLVKTAVRACEETDGKAKKELEHLLQWNVTGDGINIIPATIRMQKKGGYEKFLHLGRQSVYSRTYEMTVSITGLSAYGKHHLQKVDWSENLLRFYDLKRFTFSVIAAQLQTAIQKKNNLSDILTRYGTEMLFQRKEDAEICDINVLEGMYDEGRLRSELESIGINVGKINESRTGYSTDNPKSGTFDLTTSLLAAVLFGAKPTITQIDRIRSSDEYCFGEMLGLMAAEDFADQLEAKHRETVANTARAFEEKKNIPPKTMEAMKSSPLHRFFGDVEFDELVDLNLMSEVTKDIFAIIISFFGGKETRNIHFRVRLLGRHHATGLYWPTEHCICIDVRDPSSFLHEYMHMYDHEHGELSRKYEFLQIRQMYSELLKGWYGNQSEYYRKKMNTSVYCLDYYLTPTEVFARCGEIYFNRIRGVKNSAIGNCNGFAYPEDKQLEELIAAYFNDLLAVNQEAESVA